MALSSQVISLTTNTSDATKYDVTIAGADSATATVSDGGALLANVLAALRTAGAAATDHVVILSVSGNPLFNGVVGAA